MNLVNLDEITREYMFQEVDLDIKKNRLYYSKRFTNRGRTDYANLLRNAIKKHNADWLANQLNQEGRMKGAEVAHSRRGKPYSKRTPVGDQKTIAFGEFNRFYIRGLCARAVDNDIDHLIVYRAQKVSTSRSRSASMINQQIDPQELLNDLRENIGKSTKLGIPGGPNSGISVKLPDKIVS